jgi:hypothetical protein
MTAMISAASEPHQPNSGPQITPTEAEMDALVHVQSLCQRYDHYEWTTDAPRWSPSSENIILENQWLNSS